MKYVEQPNTSELKSAFGSFFFIRRAKHELKNLSISSWFSVDCESTCEHRTRLPDLIISSKSSCIFFFFFLAEFIGLLLKFKAACYILNIFDWFLFWNHLNFKRERCRRSCYNILSKASLRISKRWTQMAKSQWLFQFFKKNNKCGFLENL